MKDSYKDEVVKQNYDQMCSAQYYGFEIFNFCCLFCIFFFLKILFTYAVMFFNKQSLSVTSPKIKRFMELPLSEIVIASF